MSFKLPRLFVSLAVCLSVLAVGCQSGSQVNVLLIDGVAYPDPLQLNSGAVVADVETWENTRRDELLADFRQHVYGTPLPTPLRQSFEVVQTDLGTATYKRVAITVAGPYGTGTFPIRLYVPKGDDQPRGTFLFIDISPEKPTGDLVPAREVFPVAELNARGYAAALLDTDQVALDSTSYRTKMIDLFYPAAEPLPADAGRAIAAWAWGASRAMDYLQADPDIDPAKIAVVGHSRGGKAALWAGAQDQRFSTVIANNSGSTGAKLARRLKGDGGKGEDVGRINNAFPHWFAGTYASYNYREAALPVDQHELLALIAPRRVYVTSASLDSAADPESEFLAYQAAEPVYRLYGVGGTGLPSTTWRPALDTAFRGAAMSYHIRDGYHGLKALDWRLFMNGDVFTAGTQQPSDPRATPLSGDGQRPFLGRLPVLGTDRVEAEHYDVGGQDVSYSESSPTKNGDASFRTGDSVDVVSTTDLGGGQSVGHIVAGEWLEYSVAIPAGTYAIRLRMATASTYRDRRVSVFLTSSPSMPRKELGTATLAEGTGWQSWQTVTLPGVTVDGSPNAVLRLEAQDSSFNLNWVEFVPVP